MLVEPVAAREEMEAAVVMVATEQVVAEEEPIPRPVVRVRAVR